MKVQLEILQGRLKQGNEAAGLNRFTITLRRFIVGSDPSCHMVCKSRTISQRHCLILIENDNVLVRDLNSKAGTFVNDVPVAGTQLLVNGDKLRIGRLEFRLLVTGARPRSCDAPAASPAAPTRPDEKSIDTLVGSDTVDALVTDLLQHEDEAARAARYADPAARYFRADAVPPSQPAAAAPDQPARKQRPPKKRVGKLPTPPPIKAEDTVSAAEQALEEIFHPAKGTRKS